jgi:hypothetical protein
MPKSAKSVAVKPAAQVYDSETGAVVEFDQKQRDLALYLHQQIIVGAFTTAMSLKRLFDDKLYLALGYGSRQEYCTALPFGMRQVQKYLMIAEKIVPALPGDVAEDQSGLSNLGMTKLVEIAKLDATDIKSLASGEQIETPDGPIDAEIAQDISARALAEQLKKAREKAVQLTEKNKLLKDELDDRDKTIESSKEKIENAKSLERLYGPAASLLEEKREHAKDARARLNEACRHMEQLNASVEDPDEFQAEVLRLVDFFSHMADTFRTKYQEVIANASIGQ